MGKFVPTYRVDAVHDTGNPGKPVAVWYENEAGQRVVVSQHPNFEDAQKGATRLNDAVTSRPRCGGCRFFQNTETGQCRKYAPKPVVAIDDVAIGWDWPPIDKDQWCGEFEPLAKP